MLLKNKNLKSVRKSVRKQKKIRAKSIKIWLYINGCGSKTRTYDLRVMSPTSYQLLHPAILYLKWWLGTESNRRHKDFQSFALPTELPSQIWCLGPESNRHGCHHPQDFKSCASTSSATQAFNYFRHAPIFKNGVLQRTRTSDPLIKSQMLYQLS